MGDNEKTMMPFMVNHVGSTFANDIQLYLLN